MKIRLRFLILIPLLLASCSEKQDEPATPEEAMDTELVASRKVESDEEDTEKADSFAEVEMHEEVIGEVVTPDSSAKYPEVTPVPDQPGFVYSPFNNQIIDVRDFPPGTLVADPSYPPSEKKYFRVP